MYQLEREHFRRLADVVTRTPDWQTQYPEYVAYAQAMAQGRLNDAIHKHIRPLIQRMLVQAVSARMALLDEVCTVAVLCGAEPEFIPLRGVPRELLHRIFEPTLQEQCAAQPTDPRAHLWATVLHVSENPHESLDLALSLGAPSPAGALAAAKLSLAWLQYALHELPSGLLDTPSSIEQDAARIAALAKYLPNQVAANYLEIAAEQMKRLHSFQSAQNGL